MDWSAVISRNHAILVRIIAELFAMLRQAENKTPGTLSRPLFYAILAVLRPAESAVRRLIIIAARGLTIKPRQAQPFPRGGIPPSFTSLVRAPAFNLIDPLKTFSLDTEPAQMFSFVDKDQAPANHDIQFVPASINAAMLLNRLRALRLALSSLPRQARRLARWRAQHDLKVTASTRTMRLSPFRPGPPPGSRKRQIHEVDAVLGDVHYFAKQAWWDTT